jgi:hypothetical protein
LLGSTRTDEKPISPDIFQLYQNRTHLSGLDKIFIRYWLLIICNNGMIFSY